MQQNPEKSITYINILIRYTYIYIYIISEVEKKLFFFSKEVLIHSYPYWKEFLEEKS